MKKALLLSLLGLASAQLKAQNLINEYYNYGNTLWENDNYNGNYAGYYGFYMFPDSTVVESYSNGVSSVSTQSDGQVFDPTDPNFNFTNTVLTQYTNYTVDSFAFGYSYQRYQNAAPDTLLLQIYDDSNIIYNSNPGFTNGASYATVKYNYKIREGANAILSQKYLLTYNDTISPDSESYLTFPVNLNVPGGKKIAATVTYFPGNPYTPGDTIDPSLDPHTHINSFQIFDFGSNQVASSYYNNELTADPTIRYNYNPFYDGEYIPGTAYGDTVYNLDAIWNITFDSAALAVKNIQPVTSASIYPNPVSDNGVTNLVFNLANDDDLTINVFNDLGINVMSFAGKHYNAGRNQLSINAGNLPPGIYLCNIKSSEGAQLLKLAVE